MSIRKRALAKYLRVSPFKVRRVGKLVRQKSVVEALNILSNMPNKSARILHDVVKSAASNAVDAGVAGFDELIIDEILINEGPRMKRFQPRARGRIFQIIKRSSHISVTVQQVASVQGGKS